MFTTDMEFHIDNFMLYCSSKNLSRKTLASYEEQTLKLLTINEQIPFELGHFLAEASGTKEYCKPK